MPSVAGNVGPGAQEMVKVRSWMEDRGLSGNALTKRYPVLLEHACLVSLFPRLSTNIGHHAKGSSIDKK